MFKYSLDTASASMYIIHLLYCLAGIGVREGILLVGWKKFALKITICPKNRQLALKLTF